MSEHNGKNGAAAQTVSPDEQIDSQLRQAVGFMIRGILVSAPGIPPELIAKSIARIVGELLGQAVIGDLVAVLKIRSDCKDAFATSIGRMPVIPKPGNAPPQKLNG